MSVEDPFKWLRLQNLHWSVQKKTLDCNRNKHVVFDGHLFHGVIGPLSKIKPTKDSKRITLVVNYYVKKPIEPNCINVPHEKLSLLPLTDEHIQLQESNLQEKSKNSS